MSAKQQEVDRLIEQYGADTARLFMMFAAPPEQTLEWSDSGVEGAYRFMKRVWSFGHTLKSQASAGEAGPLRREIHLLLNQANYDLGKLQLNTVASACMKMLNTLEEAAKPAAMSEASEAGGER
jgi:leucyl-tRNA synthetase